MKIRLILFAIAGILLFLNCSFSQTRQSSTGSIPYSTQDTFYLNRAGALRVLKMQADYSFCQQSARLKDSVISRQNLLYDISQRKNSILQNRLNELSTEVRKKRVIVLRQRIAGVGIIAVLVLAVLSG